MFATQQYAEANSDFGRKRLREEEHEFNQSSTSFGEHRNKRLQCLPLRTSAAEPQQWPPTTSITPLHSDSDERQPQSHFSPYPPSPGTFHPQQSTDMDMMDSAHLQTPQQVATRDATGRMPTPIQPSFASQVRGRHCEWIRRDLDNATPNGIVNMGHQQTGFADDQCVPRAMVGEADWQSVQTHRRLPSPISETEDCHHEPVGSSEMMAEDGIEQSQLSARLRNSSLSQSSPPSHVMDHPNAMEIECRPSQGSDSEEDPSSPSPNRRGHVRSKHTINSWTLQPGMKKSFSIGYRSDCEKCRLKVPGHFNHIIVS